MNKPILGAAVLTAILLAACGGGGGGANSPGALPAFTNPTPAIDSPFPSPIASLAAHPIGVTTPASTELPSTVTSKPSPPIDGIPSPQPIATAYTSHTDSIVIMPSNANTSNFLAGPANTSVSIYTSVDANSINGADNGLQFTRTVYGTIPAGLPALQVNRNPLFFLSVRASRDFKLKSIVALSILGISDFDLVQKNYAIAAYYEGTPDFGWIKDMARGTISGPIEYFSFSPTCSYYTASVNPSNNCDPTVFDYSVPHHAILQANKSLYLAVYQQ